MICIGSSGLVGEKSTVKFSILCLCISGHKLKGEACLALPLGLYIKHRPPGFVSRNDFLDTKPDNFEGLLTEGKNNINLFLCVFLLLGITLFG